jgi:hypothetical protein
VESIENEMKELVFFGEKLEEAPLVDLPQTVQDLFRYSGYFHQNTSSMTKTEE